MIDPHSDSRVIYSGTINKEGIPHGVGRFINKVGYIREG